MKISKKVQNRLWACFRPGKYPNGYVSILENGEVDIQIYMKTTDGFALTIPRRLARMLARRINQALDA